MSRHRSAGDETPASPIDPRSLAQFSPRLLAWFDAHGRHDLPWTRPRTPYRVWLSEVMLQQTQVATVIPYFERFVAALPDLPSLARASADEVHALWSGLGYYSRARNLHAAARHCMDQHGGDLPRDFDALLALPGIGRSTAGAILAQAWGDRFAILDGNVRRVLARLHGIEGWTGLPVVERQLWDIANASLPLDASRMADYTQAQMDLGATVCTRGRPGCSACPLAGLCVAHRDGRTATIPSPRPARKIAQRETAVVWLRDGQGRTLLQQRPAAGIWGSLWSLPEVTPDDVESAERIVRLHARATATPRRLPPIEHAFTHFRLRIQPWLFDDVSPRSRLGDNECLRWVARESLASVGIPAPIRRLIEEETP